MVLKVKRAWQVPLDHVVSKEKWEQVEKTLITETGNSAPPAPRFVDFSAIKATGPVSATSVILSKFNRESRNNLPKENCTSVARLFI